MYLKIKKNVALHILYVSSFANGQKKTAEFTLMWNVASQENCAASIRFYTKDICDYVFTFFSLL